MSQLLREVPRDKAVSINEDTDLELFNLDENEEVNEDEENTLIG
jgi:hypothetical protein